MVCTQVYLKSSCNYFIYLKKKNATLKVKESTAKRHARVSEKDINKNGMLKKKKKSHKFTCYPLNVIMMHRSKIEVQQ